MSRLIAVSVSDRSALSIGTFIDILQRAMLCIVHALESRVVVQAFPNVRCHNILMCYCMLLHILIAIVSPLQSLWRVDIVGGRIYTRSTCPCRNSPSQIFYHTTGTILAMLWDGSELVFDCTTRCHWYILFTIVSGNYIDNIFVPMRTEFHWPCTELESWYI